MHTNQGTKKCHYFNNAKTCPYEEVGCMFLHESSETCYLSKNCKNKLCPYQHHSAIIEDEAKDKLNVESKGEKQEEVETLSVIIGAFVNDEKEHFNVNKDCGLNNDRQKCKKCKFITHSMGLLRMHEKDNHNIKHPFDKITVERCTDS